MQATSVPCQKSRLTSHGEGAGEPSFGCIIPLQSHSAQWYCFLVSGCPSSLDFDSFLLPITTLLTLILYCSIPCPLSPFLNLKDVYIYYIESGDHHETSFYIIWSPTAPLVLGLPWHKLYNPHIDWFAYSITNWCLFLSLTLPTFGHSHHSSP